MKSHKVGQYIHYINPQRIREKGLERSFEKIIGENVLNLRKDMNLHIQVAKWTGSRAHTKRHTKTHHKLWKENLKNNKRTVTHHIHINLCKTTIQFPSKKPWRPEDVE